MHQLQGRREQRAVDSSADLLHAVRMSGSARYRAMAQLRRCEAMVDLALGIARGAKRVLLRVARGAGRALRSAGPATRRQA